MRMQLAVGFVLIASVGCGRIGENFADENAMDDVELVEPQADGSFVVHCRNGTVERVSQQDMVNDKVCTPEAPAQDLLCGRYDQPLTLRAGVHLVTCNTTFTEKVVLEPGAQLLADGPWQLRFEHDVFAVGSESKPIVFGMSRNSEAEEWNAIEFFGKSPLVLSETLEYQSGTVLKHARFSGISSELALYKAYVTDTSIAYAHSVRLDGFLGHSFIAMNDMSFDDRSYFVHNVVAGKDDHYISFYGDSVFFGWNAFSVGHSNYLNQSYVVFNTVDDLQRHGVGSLDGLDNVVFGNAFSVEDAHPMFGQTDNPAAVLVGTFPFFQETSLSLNEKFTTSIVGADARGWRFDLPLTLTPTYQVDGQQFEQSRIPLSSWVPTLSFDRPEQYTLRFETDSVPLVMPDSRIHVM